MKILTLISFIVLATSCNNNKTNIVEEIKIYKDSSKLVQIEMLQVTIDDTKKYEEMFWTNGKVDLSKVKDSKIQKDYNNYQGEIEVRKWELKFKQAKFKSIIDSLELELKKY